MQVRNFFVLLLFVGFLFNGAKVNAQKLTTNEEGEKIIVYPDGSWRYFDDTEPDDIEEVLEAEKILEEAKKKKKKKKKSKRSKKNNKKDNAKDVIYDEASENAARNEAIRVADVAARDEEIAKHILEDLVFKRIFLEEELSDAFQNTEMTHEDVAVIEQKLETAKEEEKAAKDSYQSAVKYAKKMEKMIDLSKAKRDKLMAKMGGSSIEKESNVDKDKSDFAEVNESPFQDEGQAVSVSTSNRKTKTYNPKENVMIYPPFKDCQLAFDDVDEFTGKKRKDVEKQLFFTYTPERFEPYFKGRNYITCYGYLSHVSGGLMYLNLEFVIATEQAAREFGVLERGSQLIIRGLDGKRLVLQNKKTASGTPNSLNKTTTYRAQYVISGKQEKTLKKLEVDKVRVIWGTGYEDYEVYEVDFLINQLKCIKQ